MGKRQVTILDTAVNAIENIRNIKIRFNRRNTLTRHLTALLDILFNFRLLKKKAIIGYFNDSLFILF